MFGVVAIMMGLLVTVALASRSHPLSHSGSVSRRTSDILMVAGAIVAGALIVALAIESHRPDSRARRRLGVGDVLLALVLIAAITAGSYGAGRVFHPAQASATSRQKGVPCVKYEQAHGRPTSNCAGPTPPPRAKPKHQTAQMPAGTWLVIGAILALLTSGGGLFALERRRPSSPLAENGDARRETIVDALNLSIDDLRQEPDARRAIVAAYARMEVAFTAAGLPRQPSEAPYEFLVRSLGELDASAEAAARLTELFELANFSHHAPTLAMRDEAVDAFLAIRDELNAAQRLTASATEATAAAAPAT